MEYNSRQQTWHRHTGIWRIALVALLATLVVLPRLNTTNTASAAAPTITTFNPTSGPTGGGTTVVITGTGLTGVSSVTFGGLAASLVGSSIDGTVITVTTPATTTTVPVSITVSASGGITTALQSYTYTLATPTIGGVTPNTAPNNGGTSVTITGTNFVTNTAVSFGGTPAASVNVVSATELTAVTPVTTSTSTVVITVSNSITMVSNGVNFTFTTPPPTATPTNTPVATSTPTSPPVVVIPANGTYPTSGTVVPVVTATPLSSPTVTPTATITPTATVTPTATAIPPTNTAVPTAPPATITPVPTTAPATATSAAPGATATPLVRFARPVRPDGRPGQGTVVGGQTTPCASVPDLLKIINANAQAHVYRFAPPYPIGCVWEPVQVTDPSLASQFAGASVVVTTTFPDQTSVVITNTLDSRGHAIDVIPVPYLPPVGAKHGSPQTIANIVGVVTDKTGVAQPAMTDRFVIIRP